MERMICDAMDKTTKESGPEGPHLGIRIISLNAALARQHGVPDTAGIVVQQVTDCGPADRAGVKSGDVIRRFNGQPVANARVLASMVNSARPGTVTLDILREGQPMNIPVDLGGRPSGADGGRATAAAGAGEQPDWLIVAGERIGRLLLGAAFTDAMNVLGGAAECDDLAVAGTDIGESECNLDHWGLQIDFSGDPSSRRDVRRASVIIASAERGDAARRFVTDRGIRIGSSEQDVLRAYGTPSQRERYSGGGFFMSYDKIGLSFDLSEQGQHVVQGIRVFRPSQ
jgi:membrane-associated protease RseP (regulator of RpoE activity)